MLGDLATNLLRLDIKTSNRNSFELYNNRPIESGPVLKGESCVSISWRR